MERRDANTPAERAYGEYVEGVDRALAPLRVVGRLGFLPQGAENCVDVFEVIDVVNHFLDDAEALRHMLDVALEVRPEPPSKSAEDRRSGKNGSADVKPPETPREKKGDNKAKD